jgi:hypothetical protein
MPDELIKSDLLLHDFGRTRGPRALAFDFLKSLEAASDVDQQAREFRANHIERLMHTLSSVLIPTSPSKLRQRQ